MTVRCDGCGAESTLDSAFHRERRRRRPSVQLCPSCLYNRNSMVNGRQHQDEHYHSLTWLEFDHAVLGGNYHSHHPVGPVTRIEVVPGAERHPILAGITLSTAGDALYKNSGHATDINVLLRGTIEGQPSEPLAWTRHVNGGRVFYTSLGAQETFRNPDFRRMLANALFWTAGHSVEAR